METRNSDDKELAKANYEHILKAANTYSKLERTNAVLLEALKEAKSSIELAINGTPSGDFRNLLCDKNISITSAISEAENNINND